MKKIKGSVNEFGVPELKIALVIKGKIIPVVAMVDTGFNSYLSVPKRIAKHWEYLAQEEFEIATGEIVKQDVYLGKMLWFGKSIPVYSISSESEDVLMGTSLLKGTELKINFKTRVMYVEKF